MTTPRDGKPIDVRRPKAWKSRRQKVTFYAIATTLIVLFMMWFAFASNQALNHNKEPDEARMMGVIVGIATDDTGWPDNDRCTIIQLSSEGALTTFVIFDSYTPSLASIAHTAYREGTLVELIYENRGSEPCRGSRVVKDINTNITRNQE